MPQIPQVSRALRFSLLCSLALLGLAACGGTTSAIAPTPPRAPSATTATRAATLPLGCADPAQAAITSATRISVQPDHGPVGTRVRVAVTGARANCHLTLNLAAPPALSETNNVAETRPGLSYPVQWVVLDASGEISMSFCVCAVIPMWASAGPAITSVTPQPDTFNAGDYAPKPGDYFFLTLGALGAAPSDAPFVRFTVTR